MKEWIILLKDFWDLNFDLLLRSREITKVYLFLLMKNSFNTSVTPLLFNATELMKILIEIVTTIYKNLNNLKQPIKPNDTFYEIIYRKRIIKFIAETHEILNSVKFYTLN
jgi:hypothetical protein